MLIKKIKEQLNKDDKKNLLLFLVPLMLYFGYKIYIHSSVKKGNFTIGYVTKIYWPIISHKKINYTYIVNGIEYTGSDIYNSKFPMKEYDRILIQFSTKYNSESEIIKNFKISDSIKTIPKNGWKILPK